MYCLVEFIFQVTCEINDIFRAALSNKSTKVKIYWTIFFILLSGSTLLGTRTLLLLERSKLIWAYQWSASECHKAITSVVKYGWHGWHSCWMFVVTLFIRTILFCGNKRSFEVYNSKYENLVKHDNSIVKLELTWYLVARSTVVTAWSLFLVEVKGNLTSMEVRNINTL